jgi:hypothetical protein
MVATEEHTMMIRRVRMGGIACAAVYGYISINAFTTWQLGVRDVAAFTTAHVLWGCAFLSGLVTVWKPSYVPLFVAYLFGITTCVFVTSIYNPYLMVPPLLTMHAVLFALVQHWRMRIAMVVIACAGWTASVFGESLGFLPNTVRYTNGDMLIHSDVIALPEVGMTVYLYLAVLAMLVMPALVIGALRSAWLKSDRAMRLQVWQLRRLVATENEYRVSLLVANASLQHDRLRCCTQRECRAPASNGDIALHVPRTRRRSHERELERDRGVRATCDGARRRFEHALREEL